MEPVIPCKARFVTLNQTVCKARFVTLNQIVFFIMREYEYILGEGDYWV